jgi:hypothetical protein
MRRRFAGYLFNEVKCVSLDHKEGMIGVAEHDKLGEILAINKLLV